MNSGFKRIAVFVGTLLLLFGLAGSIVYFKGGASNSSELIEVTKDNFQKEVVDSSLPVLMVFYVPGPDCKPCLKQDPVVEAVAKDYKGKVKVLRVDALANLPLSQAVGVQAVPTLVFFQPAEKIGIKAEGFLEEAKLRDFIEKGLALKAPAKAVPSAPAPSNDPALQK